MGEPRRSPCEALECPRAQTAAHARGRGARQLTSPRGLGCSSALVESRLAPGLLDLQMQGGHVVAGRRRPWWRRRRRRRRRRRWRRWPAVAVARRSVVGLTPAASERPAPPQSRNEAGRMAGTSAVTNSRLSLNQELYLHDVCVRSRDHHRASLSLLLRRAPRVLGPRLLFPGDRERNPSDRFTTSRAVGLAG